MATFATLVISGMMILMVTALGLVGILALFLAFVWAEGKRDGTKDGMDQNGPQQAPEGETEV